MSFVKKTEEKYLKVVSDLREGRYKTVELACKANKISPASYHIYRKRDEMAGNFPPAPASSSTSSTKNYSGDDASLKSVIADLEAKNRDLEEKIAVLKTTLMSLLK